MLISKTVTLEEADLYQAIKDYLVKTLIVEDESTMCSISLDEDKTMARVVLQQEHIKP